MMDHGSYDIGDRYGNLDIGVAPGDREYGDNDVTGGTAIPIDVIRVPVTVRYVNMNKTRMADLF